jgi:hypothetical protein
MMWNDASCVECFSGILKERKKIFNILVIMHKLCT